MLGCAGMAEFAHEIEAAIGAPVVEGVTAAVKWAEALIALKLSTAKRGDFARPLTKRYDGEFARFSPGGAPAHAASVSASAGAATPAAVEPTAATSDVFPQPHIHSV